jgi:DNA-binding transcriptional LysR family regulator
MVPTSAGLRLLRHAEQTLSEFEALRPLFSDYRELKLGHVRVACESWLSGYLLPQLVAVFSASHPKVTMSVYQLSSDEVIQAIDNGHAEIGIAGSYEQRHTVRMVKTIPASCGAVVAVGHPLAGRESLALEEVMAFPLVQFGRPGRPDFFLKDVLEQQAGPHQVGYSTNSFALAEATIASGNAVGILPRPGRMLVGTSHLTYIPIDQPDLQSHRYGVFIPTNRHLDSIERRLIAAVGEILSP